MATSPMIQSVLLFQHHQTTTPFLPHVTRETGLSAAKSKEEKEEPVEENNEEEQNEENEENEESGEEQNA